MGLAAVLTLTGLPHEAEALTALRAAAPDTSVILARAGDAPLPDDTLPVLPVDSLWSHAAVRQVLDALLATGAEQFLWLLPPAAVVDPVGLRRLLAAAADTGAALAYADFLDVREDGSTVPHPVIDWQPGSVRDDFDFGPLLVISRAALAAAATALETSEPSRFGGLYDLRLRLTGLGPVVHLSDPVARRPLLDVRTSGQKNFDYVNPRQRDYQVEMERIATAHLARIGALLEPPSRPLVEDGADYPVVASVVIPVRNRAGKVGDAVRSALAQQASFAFNVIVVDNHSTDGTSDELQALAAADERVVHIIPERRDLGIGGCWNEAIFSPRCGRYAVQLDSDDLYDGDDVLARVVAKFQEAPYALVIGSYTLVDVELNELPPGLIDHREWTDDNGFNNALRIAGLGAPRAYHTPTLRTIGFPNASYGEDYAVVLRMSREWPVGRIYESLYWCRRWEGNTDSALPLETSNRYSMYKDRLRSIEIAARMEQQRTASGTAGRP
jgi:hypothetical protein